MPKTVLISGAGIAGTTLAWWLSTNGFAPTVVERAGSTRSSGAPVDVQGEARAIVTAMGVLDRLRDAATEVREMVIVDDKGRTRSRIDMGAFATGEGDFELPRNDLARILCEAGSDRAEYIFGDEIVALSETSSAVEVRFDSGIERRFDLVIGTDGLHSRVRRLAFGPEDRFVHHKGLYFAGTPIPSDGLNPHQVLMHNAPGRALALHPGRDRAMSAFIFRHDPVAGFDHRDPDQHKAILAAAYGNDGWRVPEMLERAMAAPDLYFDAVSQVVIDTWSRGRVSLVGDAASSTSLFGSGTSLAIAGARILAEELAATPDHAAAFARYEQRHRLAVTPRQNGMGLVSTLLVPRTRTGIAGRNLALKALQLGLSIGRLTRRRQALEQRHA
jgi:2-polyprenyl-6-methoxyphenol hydroxylase-like FAD-dependent oxidoreductase